MVGIENDKIILSPLEQAVKGQTEVNKNLIRVSEILSI
jgi:6-phosphofructokinase 1